MAAKRFTKFKEGDPILWGKATAIIHASAKEVFAWIWLYTSNHRMKSHQKKERNIIRQFYEAPNEDASHEEQVSTNKIAQHSNVRRRSSLVSAFFVRSPKIDTSLYKLRATVTSFVETVRSSSSHTRTSTLAPPRPTNLKRAGGPYGVFEGSLARKAHTGKSFFVHRK